MACLSTSGRQGLFVAVGTSRRYHNHKFLCQLVLQQDNNNINKRNNNTVSKRSFASATSGNVGKTNKAGGTGVGGGAVATASRLLSCATTSASLSNAPLALPFQQQTKRYFHGIQDAAARRNNVFTLMVSE